MSSWITGMDLSTLLEVERCGGRFYDHGVAGDAMDILKTYGMNMVRLRLWNDPFSEDGSPYGAGGNDLEATLTLAKRAKEKGVGWLLDFHYSDFWADPGKQTIPKAWRGMNTEQLEKAVYDYTAQVLKRCRQEGVLPQMAAVGNELTKGLLWPYGKVPQFDNIARFVSAGIRAVREASPEIQVMVHLDNGGNNELYRSWFDAYFASGGADFDCIGLSYYPFWHGTIEMLRENMNDIARRYGKDLIVAEVSMGHTMEDYQAYERLGDGERKGMATRQELVENIGYPMTHQGQADFMKDVLKVVRQVPENRGKGFFYWEPAWIPVPGSGWATPEACAYIGEAGPGGNEWANQALFDYSGNALPALEVIRDFR
ncbi:MAG: glycosyl hydrolase 53 family protein [Eubacteriales bacterium]|nr:glycosyl hydrolase 53 family protein [Eubacteriales bacterium]